MTFDIFQGYHALNIFLGLTVRNESQMQNFAIAN